MTAHVQQPHSRLIPVTKWSTEHQWPPLGGLRHLIFHAETNGFKSAFKRVGRRVLIDETEFFRCVDRQNRLIKPPTKYPERRRYGD